MAKAKRKKIEVLVEVDVGPHVRFFNYKMKDAHTKEIMAWVRIMCKTEGIAEIMHMYTFPQFRRQGLLLNLIEKIKLKSDAVVTDYDGSTLEGRALCMKAGMKKEGKQDGITVLVWYQNKEAFLSGQSKIIPVKGKLDFVEKNRA